MIAVMSFYVTTSDLLRQCDAARRPRLHDDRRGHPRAPPSSARRGDLLPDGHGRARLEHRAVARGGAVSIRRSSSIGTQPSSVEMTQQDRTSPTTSSSARPTSVTKRLVPGVPCSGSTTPGEIYEGTYAGLYCSRCESFYTEAELVDGKCPQHGTVPEYVEEKNYFFRLSAYQDRLLDSVRRRTRSSCCRSFATTRRAASSSRGSTTSASAAPRNGGAFRPLGSGSGRLRLGRRAHQLLERACLRPRGRGPPPNASGRRCTTSWRRTSSSSTA